MRIKSSTTADAEGAGYERHRAIGERAVVPACYYLDPHREREYAAEARRVLGG
jgi:hypothetical protein